jgi:CheY-like chemotaxis protein
VVAPPAGEGGRLPRKVLVVDDEPDLVELAHALLGYHGMDACIAHGGAEALEMLAADPTIDALFSDVMMPGMNGLELADATYLHFPHVHILLTSGYTAPDLIAPHSRQYAYISKPYRIDDVIARLRR